jgi:hypothetical protein
MATSARRIVVGLAVAGGAIAVGVLGAAAADAGSGSVISPRQETTTTTAPDSEPGDQRPNKGRCDDDGSDSSNSGTGFNPSV